MDRARISEVSCHVSSKPVVSSPVPWKICRFKFQPNSTPAGLFLSVWLKARRLVKLVGEVLIENRHTPPLAGLCEWCPAEPDCTTDILLWARQRVQECCNIILVSITCYKNTKDTCVKTRQNSLRVNCRLNNLVSFGRKTLENVWLCNVIVFKRLTEYDGIYL